MTTGTKNGNDRRGLLLPLGVVITLIGAAVGYGSLQATVSAHEDRLGALENRLVKLCDEQSRTSAETLGRLERIQTLLEERTGKK